eukprot:SM000192S04895  [mRNA]  locus=s192:52862:62216:+ [translate_table: standard]
MAAPEATRLTFAYYVTGHGLGHATRVVEVARHLVAAGHEVHVVTGAPAYVFEREIASPALRVRQVLLDCGAVQSDALTVDRLASLEQYRRTAVIPRDSLLATEAAWLQFIGAHLVVSDVVPIACAAAAQASVPAVCVSNFSWDFVYSEYVMEAGHDYQDIVWQIAEDYSKAALLIRLPGFCPMPAFRDIVDVPLVVREARRSRAEVRKHLGLAEGTKLLLYNFGGQDGDWSLQESFLPSDWKGVVCTTLPVGNLPPNFVKPDRDTYTPDLIAACDCMLGQCPLPWTSYTTALLRQVTSCLQTCVKMRRRDFFDGTWAPYLSRALTIKPCYNGPLDGGKVVANFLEAAARGQVGSISLQSGNSRLKDAIIFGYKLHRYPGRIHMEVPDWYTKEQYHHQDSSLPIGSVDVVEEQRSHGDFDILHGSTHGLSDTIEFLQMLSTLDAAGNVQASDAAPVPQPNEVLAAGKFFCWEEDVYVTRAPGRLDVMGGIADYSGSLVLQMPIKEACHVALQRNALGTQKLWKHTEARNDGSTKAALQIVSFGADQANRAPSFDMNLLEFLDETGDPITYATAREYFNQDPSRRWAAYMAGCVLVLMRERSVRFTDGINILVASRVPEGKGVSSSAAVEVATMSALSAAYDLRLLPRELAILCQKGSETGTVDSVYNCDGKQVENEVVGAPCGVMDQMASACGEANKLLAMVCQPAEVKEHVVIPSHVQFWGLDSGIRHSVGGADYGTVRAGAFMGRKVIQAEAQARRDVASTALARTASGLLADGSEYVEEEQLDYLCNIPPHRYEALYSSLLPEQMEALDFLARYDDHDDNATTLLPTRQYPIRAATSHPINENFRVQLFASLLGAESTELQLQVLGELMYQSHESYSRCGLGSDGTDQLVSLTRHFSRSAQKPGLHGLGMSLFGAKITGGGCGGTVCILGRRDAAAQAEVEQIQQEYKLATGHLPHKFEGSSPGAGRFGFLRIRRRHTNQTPHQETET